MNNISGYIQPNIYPSPIVGIVQPAMPITSSGNYTDMMTTVMITVIIIIVLFVIYKNMNNKNDESEEYESFSSNYNYHELLDDLTKCGWLVVMSPACHYCIKQKEILKEYFPLFNNINYDLPVNAVPTWINIKTKKIVPGLQTYDKLLKMANCVVSDGLTENGWEVYMSQSCPYCMQQRELLTDSFPTFVNIRYDVPVRVVPTWYNSRTNEIIEGLQNYENLMNMSKSVN